VKELPPGWAWTTLGEIANLKGGLAKGKRRRPEDRLRAVPYLRVENVQRGYLNLDKMKLIEATEAEIDDLRLRVGDVLFNEGGDRDKLGRGWIWQGALAECIHQNHVFRARLRAPDIQPMFLSLYGNSEGATYFNDQGKQTTNLASINLTKLSEFPVPLPPASEQGRIVAEVDRYLSLLDTGASLLTGLKEKVSRLADAIFSRTLSPVTHPRHHADGGLRRGILAERERSGGSSFPLPPDNSIGLVSPPGWEVMSLDELTTRITSGSRDWSPYYGSGNGTFILAQNVRRGRLDFSFRQSVDPPQGDSSVQRSLVKRGDLLITIVGAVGDTCAITEELNRHYVCQSVALARPVLSQLSKYLMFWLLAPRAGAAYFKKCSYGQGRPHLSFNQIRRTPVLVPPMGEMEIFVARIEDHLSLTEVITNSLNACVARAARLRQALLKKAFEGELVPQDPSDEPASVLLDRIRAARAQVVR
jgi:type I restriction enzyme S subunit